MLDADDTLDRAERDNDERKTLWWLLSAYDMSDDYFEFCRMVKIRPGLRASEQLFDLTHYAFVAAWKRYGWDRLQQMIRVGWNTFYLHHWK